LSIVGRSVWRMEVIMWRSRCRWDLRSSGLLRSVGG
jgi:hypothetical protein